MRVVQRRFRQVDLFGEDRCTGDPVAVVLELRPDDSGHPGRWDIGVIEAYDPGSDSAFELRAFFTEGDHPLREDPVTGSLNAAAAEWLLAGGRATAPYVAMQGAAMGRRGRVHVTVEDGRVWVGGRVEVVVEGSTTLRELDPCFDRWIRSPVRVPAPRAGRWP